MKKLASIILIITVLILLVSCSNKKIENIKIENIKEILTIGDTKKLHVVDNNEKTVSNKNVFWSSSNTNIGTISEDGIITIKKEGFFTVTAKYKDDLSISDEMDIFTPYSIVENKLGMVQELENGYSTTELLQSVITHGYKYGKMIVGSLSGKVKDILTSFFEKDVYLFSLGAPYLKVTDGVIYTISDWTNEAVHFSIEDLNVLNLYNSVLDTLIKDGERGESFSDLIFKIKSDLATKFVDDGCYHLEKMDDKYEYRIVIRADYISYKMVDFYNNGIITGLVMSIKDIINWDLAKVANNYCYQKVKNEIFDVRNLKVCIEYREKE